MNVVGKDIRHFYFQGSRYYLEYLLVLVYAFSLSFNFVEPYVTQRTPSSLLGVVIVLYVILFCKTKVHKLAFLIGASFYFVLGIDFIRDRIVDDYLIVFCYNVIVYYSLSIISYRMKGPHILLLMVSFIAGYFATFLSSFAEIMSEQGRVFIGGLNPNDSAAIGFISISFLYLISTKIESLNLSSRQLNLSKILVVVSTLVCIYLITLAGTRFAILGVIILSVIALGRHLFVRKHSKLLSYEFLVLTCGLLFSVLSVSGLFGTTVSERLTFEYNAYGNEPKKIVMSINRAKNHTIWGAGVNEGVSDSVEEIEFDLGKVDGSLGSIGGRLPSWKLAYYVSLNDSLMGVGRLEFDKIRQVLLIHSPHNFLVESYVLAGSIGAGLILLVIIISGVVFAFRYFYSEYDSLYLVFIPILIMGLLLNIWYLKPFWFALSILVGAFASNRLSSENSFSN